MNTRMFNIRKFFMSTLQQTDAPYLWYFNNAAETQVTTEYYYGTSQTVKIPLILESHDVTEVGATTFCMNTNITSAEIPYGIDAVY